MCFECFLGDHQCGVVSPHQRENISTNDRGEISLVASNPIPVDNDLSHTALSLCCNWITGVAISRYGIKLDRERSDNPLASTSTIVPVPIDVGQQYFCHHLLYVTAVYDL